MEFMRLRRGSVYAAAYQFSIVITAIIRLLLLMVGFLFTAGGHKRELFRPAFAKWVKLLRWGLRMETWTKQAV
jgi:hypothetical protein